MTRPSPKGTSCFHSTAALFTAPSRRSERLFGAGKVLELCCQSSRRAPTMGSFWKLPQQLRGALWVLGSAPARGTLRLPAAPRAGEAQTLSLTGIFAGSRPNAALGPCSRSVCRGGPAPRGFSWLQTPCSSFSSSSSFRAWLFLGVTLCGVPGWPLLSPSPAPRCRQTTLVCRSVPASEERLGTNGAEQPF